MVLGTVGVLAAAGGGAAYAGVVPDFVSDRFRIWLGWKKQVRHRVQADDGSDVAVVDIDAPLVRCFCQGRVRCGELRRLAVFKDQLFLSSQPGPPDESLPLAGAEVTLQNAVIVLQLRGLPSLTLWLEDGKEAEYWEDVLRFAAQATAVDVDGQPLSLGDSPETSSKIEELENRVSAALRAAYERSSRIKELEDTVEKQQERELRIQQLEEVLHETLEEAEARAEKIEELEWQLETRTGVAADPAAAAILQDAMQFADELLADLNQEDLPMDDGNAQELREAVQAVQKAKPAVDAEVAELIRKLVTALRWPLVLRERLADAEEQVKEQEEIQEATLHEIVELQKKVDGLEAEAEERKVADEQAAKQKALTEASHAEELNKLKEREEDALKKRQGAEEKAKELRELLDFADQAAEEAVVKQKAELEKAHEEELNKLRHLADVTAAQQKDAQAKAQELHKQLQEAEAAIDEKAEREKEQLSAKHQDEVMQLRRQFAVAEQQRDQAEAQALNLNKQLEDAQGTEKDAELSKLRDALEAARSSQTVDQEELQKELMELKQNREATDRRRAEAEGQLQELREMLSSAKTRTDAAVASTTEDLEARHAQEMRGLQSRCESAEVREQLAEAQAQQLKERLISEANAADEASSKLADKERERELEDVRQRQKEAESKQQAADARAEELRRRLQDAEKAAAEAACRQQAAVDVAKEDEVRNLRKQMELAEEKVNKVESQASQFREKLAAAEVSMGEEAQRKRERLDSERARSLGREVPNSSKLPDVEVAASHWKEAADEASARLAQSERTFVPPNQFADKKKELEQRLLNAEKTLRNLQPVPGQAPDASNGTDSRSTPRRGRKGKQGSRT